MFDVAFEAEFGFAGIDLEEADVFGHFYHELAPVFSGGYADEECRKIGCALGIEKFAAVKGEGIEGADAVPQIAGDAGVFDADVSAEDGDEEAEEGQRDAGGEAGGIDGVVIGIVQKV